MGITWLFLGPTLPILSSDDHDSGATGEEGGCPPKRPLALPSAIIPFSTVCDYLQETDEKNQDSERFSEMSEVTQRVTEQDVLG